MSVGDVNNGDIIIGWVWYGTFRSIDRSTVRIDVDAPFRPFIFTYFASGALEYHATNELRRNRWVITNDEGHSILYTSFNEVNVSDVQ